MLTYCNKNSNGLKTKNMNIKKIRIWLKEWFNTPSISIKNVKDSNISIKVNGKEKLK
ncbi:hypothetical protein Phi39:1_gp03 [Cellulophaga phage phi39:1]|uniref:hypothetical protein n=1 Tax=Cellulophaga phage phi39:1 TaxID=1327993 RepID=UPI000351D067|nr:hypothetical protein Phi39:1_gp03 [Cellulophaga phage phi39:1]AGO49118.1 hypothetical protein Phi39:1_gp03 [Cellulophaga phage phi39:1]